MPLNIIFSSERDSAPSLTYLCQLFREKRGGGVGGVGHAEVSVYFESIWPLEGKEEGVALVVLLY